MRKLYYRNKLMNFLARPFENRRLFTPLQLAIYTLKDHGLWPGRLVALDAFSQTGLQWTRIIAPEAEYLEMWDIDPLAIRYAQRAFPKAKTVCGDSVTAFLEKKFHRTDYNFILIDSPVPFQYSDGSFEHFRFFDAVFNVAASQCVMIFDVVPDISRMLARHPHDEAFTRAWTGARKEFYKVTDGDGARVLPSQMIVEYSSRAARAGFGVLHASYLARNAFFGFVILVVRK